MGFLLRDVMLWYSPVSACVSVCLSCVITDRPKVGFIFVNGAENVDFKWFRQFSFSAENVIIIFISFRFMPRIMSSTCLRTCIWTADAE